MKQERTAMKVLRCKLKSTVKGRRSSLNENTIFRNEEKKSTWGGENSVLWRPAERLGLGPAASRYKAGLSHGDRSVRRPSRVVNFQ